MTKIFRVKIKMSPKRFLVGQAEVYLLLKNNNQLSHGITVNFLNIWTPKKFVVITLKFELYGSIIE